MSQRTDGSEGDLGARIERAREAMKPPPPSGMASKYNALSLAWRMTLELVVGAALGALIGWSLDELTGLSPLFLLVFGLLGFAAGVKVVFETAKESSKSMGAESGGSADGAEPGGREG
ncbi:MAG: AtpZ/AtpI family protein [Pseudomonadota bacterium]